VKTWSCKQLFRNGIESYRACTLPSRKICMAGCRKLIRCERASLHPGCLEFIDESCPQGKLLDMGLDPE
jgi:hypothetical protein